MSFKSFSETASSSSSPRDTGMSEYTKVSGLYLSYLTLLLFFKKSVGNVYFPFEALVSSSPCLKVCYINIHNVTVDLVKKTAKGQGIYIFFRKGSKTVTEV